MPTAEDVAAFLGRAGDTTIVGLAGQHLPVVTAMVKAYTRDAGFDPATGEPSDDLAAVIVSSTSRACMNPSHTVEENVGPFSVRYGTFAGWTLPELAILHRYRRRAA
ncbi:hypothetical protein [Quadrisphaera sp. GCM10027208]|uniref:hypothetical protein n=1 Tax=Quadrisphaera sp. GCM10027208 TaxID=3273423 RepID=UPI0036D40B4E